MRPLISLASIGSLIVLLAATPALAEPAAEVKAAKGVEDREPVDEGAEFAPGDTVFAWTRVTGAQGTRVKQVWKRDDAVDWTATLPIRSNRWTTRSRRKVRAGSWVVEVVTEDGTKLAEVSFVVK